MEFFRDWTLRSVLAALVLGSAARPLHAGLIIETFFGSETMDGGEENVAFEGWEDAIGFPTRKVNFDNATFRGPGIPLSQFTGHHQGLINTPLGLMFAFKSGGDLGLFPVATDPDNTVIKQAGTPFQGVTNPADLLEPNLNLLRPGANRFVDILFGKGGIETGLGELETFGFTQAVGAFVSTTNSVTLSLFDIGGGLIFEFTQTPTTMEPFFMGIVLPEAPDLLFRTRFTFDGPSPNEALDMVVFTSVNPIPGPSTVAVIGLAGLACRRRRRQPTA